MTDPDQKTAWNSEYLKKGRLWGNAPAHPVPVRHLGNVLDAGCGDGKNLRTLQAPSGMLIGFDFSVHGVHLCRRDPGCRDTALFTADARFIPLTDGSVGTVYLHHLIGHLLLPGRILAAREMCRILMSGGYLHVTVFGTGDMRERKGDQIEDRTYLRGHGIITHYFTKQELADLFPELSVQVISEHTWQMRTGRTIGTRREIVAVLEKKEETAA